MYVEIQLKVALIASECARQLISEEIQQHKQRAIKAGDQKEVQRLNGLSNAVERHLSKKQNQFT